MTAASSKPLRIVILAHPMRVAGGLSGGKNLVRSLGRVGPQHHYLVTIPPGLGYEEICAAVPHCRTIVYDHRGGLLRRWHFETFALKQLIEPFGPDVILAPGNKGLMNPPCAQVIMARDAHYFYPRKHYARACLRVKVVQAYNAWQMGRALGRSQSLLCQTPVAERRLRDRYGYMGRAVVTSNAVSAFTIDGDVQRGMPAPLAPHAGRTKLFCLTRYYAHKNLEVIPELFERFAEELDGVVVVTTFDGKEGAQARRLAERIGEPGLQGRVVNVGPLPQTELAAYYRNCQALLLPTFLESFSVTYLEAMHFGLPILTSKLDFAEEICGDAAIYFDPWDARSVKDAIVQLKRDRDLACRLVALGRQRVQTLFRSWDEIAALVLDELEKVARLN